MCSKVSILLTSFLVLPYLSYVSTYRILGVFPFISPSHYFLGNELMKGLAEAGHEATILTIFQEKNPPKNGKYRQIVMDDILEEQQVMYRSGSDVFNFSNPAGSVLVRNPFKMISIFNLFGYRVSELVLSNSKTQELMKSKQKFDVVIVTQFFAEGLKALAAHFDAHLVLFNNNVPSAWMNHFVGNPTLPSLNAETSLGFSELMSFPQRLISFIFATMTYTNFNLIQLPSQAKLVNKYISKDMDLNQILYNVSLVLSNSHTSLSKALASVPCMKEIGGFHVKPPKKLPDYLQKYLDNATDGVIYFSMGSNLKSASMPAETKEALMKAFSKRKEKVLWKFENDNMPGKPDNVRIEKWLPQSDLLAHPNIKLFITHGGFLSTIETVYHGVPTISIPIYGDQLQNAKQAETNGFSKLLYFGSLSEETMSAAIEEILSNKKYLENVKTRSKVFHDRRIKPMDEAVYWIEYIVKYKGAQHLRVGYTDLAWYQYYLLDVFGFIFAFILVFSFVIKKATCCVWRKVFKCKSSTKTIPSKKEKKL